ncbi:MAG TPA: hypothetical protein VLU25_12075 [Acidobacteriota bacterium]|nr:hypothetical protein [Acidobacteriota bacterium]
MIAVLFALQVLCFDVYAYWIWETVGFDTIIKGEYGEHLIPFPNDFFHYSLIALWAAVHTASVLFALEAWNRSAISKRILNKLQGHVDRRSLRSITLFAAIMMTLFDLELLRFWYFTGLPDDVVMDVGDWLVFGTWVNLHLLVGYAVWRLAKPMAPLVR